MQSHMHPDRQLFLDQYRSRAPQKLEIEAIVRRLATFPGLSKCTFLDIGMPNPLMSLLLRERGGVWATIARSPENAAAAAELLSENVECLGENGEIPFENGSFDCVVVSSDMLAIMKTPIFFIKECHRVISGGGRLIIGMQNRKPLSLVNVARKHAAGLTKGESPISLTFSDKDIFKLFTDGFDIVSVDTFSKLFTELARIHEYVLRLYGGTTAAEMNKKLRRIYWFSGQLDLFCFGARGHLNLIEARKRQWRERTAPVLTDGRRIQEAVLTQG